MSLEDGLNWQADISSVTFSETGERTKVAQYSNVPTRVEYISRLVIDKDGHDILSNFLFFFMVSDAPNIEPDWIVTFNSIDYDVVRADKLADLDTWHHWELFCR